MFDLLIEVNTYTNSERVFLFAKIHMKQQIINFYHSAARKSGLIASLFFLCFILVVAILGGIHFFPSSNLFLDTYQGASVESAWLAYRDSIQKDGRTIDRERNYLTTSEGQSYSLLRSVWMDDQEVFDRVYRWTKNNLQKRENDKLFHWLWGQDSNGRWGVLTGIGGRNSASDADQDIALALIFAGKRWNDDYYLKQAREILHSIWSTEVIYVKGRPYLIAGNWASSETRPTINPSYLFPAAYNIFIQIDPAHDWMSLKDTSYEVLEQATWQPLDREVSAGLPPDWVSIDPVTGVILPAIHADKTTNFSDDAFRTLWRVALDYRWHNDPRALAYLKKVTFLEEEWKNYYRLYGTYSHDGRVIKFNESSSLYGVALAFFDITNPRIAEEILNQKVSKLYDSDLETIRSDLGYYPQNWLWFGMAFYANKLPNLYVLD